MAACQKCVSHMQIRSFGKEGCIGGIHDIFFSSFLCPSWIIYFWKELIFCSVICILTCTYIDSYTAQLIYCWGLETLYLSTCTDFVLLDVFTSQVIISVLFFFFGIFQFFIILISMAEVLIIVLVFYMVISYLHVVLNALLPFRTRICKLNSRMLNFMDFFILELILPRDKMILLKM